MKKKIVNRIKRLMIITGIIDVVILAFFMFLSFNYWQLNLIIYLLVCFVIIFSWIIVNIIGIKIILRD